MVKNFRATAKLSDMVKYVKGLFGDSVLGYSKVLKLSYDSVGLVAMVSHARRVGETFIYNKGANFSQAQVMGVPSILLYKSDGTKKIHDFYHNTFGFNQVGFTEYMIKNGDAVRRDYNYPVIDVMDSAMNITTDKDGNAVLTEIEIADTIKVNEDKKILVHKVGIKINGAKVKATYNRNLNRTKNARNINNYVNPNITQVLLAPKQVG